MSVILPVEVKQRSLNGKIWLALVLAKHGLSSVIGSQYEIVENLDEFDSSIFLDKARPYGFQAVKTIKKLANHGVKCFVLDEEGGAFTDRGIGSDRLNPEILSQLTTYFCWGKKSQDYVLENTDLDESETEIVGNPRFDLLHKDKRGFFKKRAEEITNKYGDFILFNSNFTPVNFAHSDKREMVHGLTGQQCDIMRQLHNNFLELLQRISHEFDDLNVVIRPHPLENHELYKQKFNDNENIFIDFSGNCRPWILASKAVLHHNCTTGLEAYLLEKPVIHYAPISYENERISTQLSKIIHSENMVIEFIQKILNSEDDRTLQTENPGERLLKDYIWNVNNNSADQIASVFSGIIHENKNTKKVRPIFRRRVKRSIKRVVGVNIYKKVVGMIPEKRLFFDAENKKIPILERQELEGKVDRMISEIPQIKKLRYKIESFHNLDKTYKIAPK